MKNTLCLNTFLNIKIKILWLETRDSLLPVSQLDFNIENEQKKLRHSMNIAQTCSKTQVLEGSESGSTLPVNGI